MPTLKQLTCSVEWSASGPSLPLQEYRTAYSDGLVETYIPIPPIPTPFSIRLKSDGYIAPGLSMFVYIDGEYQCNRGRNNLKIPAGTTPKKQTDVDFVVRQKEEPIAGGGFVGRQWGFGQLEALNDSNQQAVAAIPKAEYMGTIEVVVLRSAEVQRERVPDPLTSEKHPLAFALGPDTVGTQALAKLSLSDLGGLFDGSSDFDEHLLPAMSFGGDMARDTDDHARGRSPHDGDWGSPYRGDHQHGHSVKQRRNDSRSASHSLPSNPAGSPAIVINVNQPAVPSSSPWAAAEPPPWNASKASLADSWNSSPAPEPVHVSHAVQGQDKTVDASWQDWIKDADKQKKGSPQSGYNNAASSNTHNSPQHSSSSSDNNFKNNGNEGGWSGNNNDAWGAPSRRERNTMSQSMSGAWAQADQNQQSYDNGNGNGWNNQGGNTSRWDAPQNPGQDGNTDWNKTANVDSNNQNSNTGWDNTGNGDSNQNGDWDNNQSGDNQGNQGPGGSNGNQGDNNGWETGEASGNNWDSGQNEQGNWKSNNNQDGNNQNGGGAWNTDQNKGQGDSGWNTSNDGNGNGNQDNTGWANNNGSDNDWNDANAGAHESQGFNAQNWNTSGDNQNGWGQGANGNNGGPASAGGDDPTKTRSRMASSGANGAKPNLSKQASINNAAQKMGWGPSSTNGANKPLGPPGAWPENPHNAVASGALQHGSTMVTKPYHVTLDAAGNPRLPEIQSAPAPLPPPPPVVPTNHSSHVQRGEPALYQHKVASPKYIDTHDRPYAVFVFRYRTKAALEQMFNITIPESEAVEKAKLANLSKEELIAEVIKIKSRTGSKADSASINSLPNAPTSINNFPSNGIDNTGPGPSGDSLGAALNGKLAALAAQNNNNSSSNSSGSKNNHLAWNSNAPPGSPIINQGNGHASSPPHWGAQNNENWNGNRNGNGGGGQIGAWLDKTPAGASVSGHEPWSGNADGSVKNGGGNKRGSGNSNEGRIGNGNGNGGDWGGSQKNGGWNSGNGGQGSQGGRWNSNGNGNGAGGQSGGWNDNTGNSNGSGGWNTAGNGQEATAGNGGNNSMW